LRTRAVEHGANFAGDVRAFGGPGAISGPPVKMSDRAPSSERSIPRSLHGASSGQVLPRHPRGSPYRCSLPGLAGFDDSRCVGPNLQRRPMKLIQHRPPSRGSSTPLKRIAGYRAPLTPRLARPRRVRDWRRGWDLNPRHRVKPVHGISSAAPSAARSPLHSTTAGLYILNARRVTRSEIGGGERI
jgi:hypothetical protein